MAVAQNILSPRDQQDFAPVPYFWSDQYELRIQSVGYLRGHDEIDIVHGDLDDLRFVAAYRTGERLAGVLTVGLPPRVLRPWRKAVTEAIAWDLRTAVESGA
jgi:hypothetical protein